MRVCAYACVCMHLNFFVVLGIYYLFHLSLFFSFLVLVFVS